GHDPHCPRCPVYGRHPHDTGVRHGADEQLWRRGAAPRYGAGRPGLGPFLTSDRFAVRRRSRLGSLGGRTGSLARGGQRTGVGLGYRADWWCPWPKQGAPVPPRSPTGLVHGPVAVMRLPQTLSFESLSGTKDSHCKSAIPGSNPGESSFGNSPDRIENPCLVSRPDFASGLLRWSRNVIPSPARPAKGRLSNQAADLFDFGNSFHRFISFQGGSGAVNETNA